MSTPIVIAKKPQIQQKILFYILNLQNRHGLIAGATGTGKTVTLKVLAKVSHGWAYLSLADARRCF